MDGTNSIEGGGSAGEYLFIPGLSDDITLEHIASKVPWKTLCALACVNLAWKRAVDEREVYNARKRTQSAQTLAAFASKSDRWVVLCDLHKQSTVLLPPLSSIRPEFHPQSLPGLMAQDGKLYAVDHHCRRKSSGSLEWDCETTFHVLDLGAGHRCWEQKSAPKITSGAELGVPCYGKLYLFERSDLDSVFRGQVFNPKRSEWSVIADGPQISSEYWECFQASRVACLNKEIYILMSTVRSPIKKVMMVFNCSTEKWRIVENTMRGDGWGEAWVVVDEKLYSFSQCSVDVYDPSSNMWAMIQPVDNFLVQGGGFVVPSRGVAPCGNEVLVLMSPKNSNGYFAVETLLGRSLDWIQSFFGTNYSPKQLLVCRSVGFGLQGRPLAWEVLPCKDLDVCLNDDSVFLGSFQL